MIGITPDGIRIERLFAALPAAVFEAWTTAAHFARWFGGTEVDIPADQLDYVPVVGGTWSATMVLPDGNTINWTGDFLEIVPNERLVLTMTDDPAAPERAAITVEFFAVNGGTRMLFTQQTPGFTTEQREATIAGWQLFFTELAADVEKTH